MNNLNPHSQNPNSKNYPALEEFINADYPKNSSNSLIPLQENELKPVNFKVAQIIKFFTSCFLWKRVRSFASSEAWIVHAQKPKIINFFQTFGVFIVYKR